MRRGRPNSLSRESILATAKEVDPEELSFLTLSQKLGVGKTSLYHYFTNLEDLQTALAEKLITESEFLDDHPLGDFSTYLVRFLTDYRDWLEQESISPSAFKINFGAVSFANGGNTEALYVRLEDFLQTADAEGIPLGDAMKIWWAITDFMSRSLAIELSDMELKGLHWEMQGTMEKSEPDQFPLSRAYLNNAANDTPTGREFYDFLVRAFVRGLIAELDLSQTRSL